MRREIEALPSGSWVVVDEIQMLPGLMNQIHDALASAPRRWRFALTASSARRLRRDDVNRLAGRVVLRRMLPLTVAELGTVPATDELLRFGMLPMVRTARGAPARVDLLEAQVKTYFTQEIRARPEPGDFAPRNLHRLDESAHARSWSSCSVIASQNRMSISRYSVVAGTSRQLDQ